MVIRHAQASYGAADYDNLSDMGHRQAQILGAYLRARNWSPDRVIIGAQRRHAQTLSGMGFKASIAPHPGLNEYDFDDLLKARFGDQHPVQDHTDRKAHFRVLRDTVHAWQAGHLVGVSETWDAFCDRVAKGVAAATQPGAKRVMMITSGGAIGRIVAAALGAPDHQMMALNLQIRNTAITRFLFSGPALGLQEFNTVPHLDHPDHQSYLTYS